MAETHGVFSFVTAFSAATQKWRLIVSMDVARGSLIVACEAALQPYGEPAFNPLVELPEKRYESVTKAELELRDIRAFTESPGILKATEIWDIHSNPHDPPDCLAKLDNRTIAIESAQIHWPSSNPKKANIARLAMFQSVRERLMADSQRRSIRMRQHVGFLLSIHFRNGNNRLPPIGQDRIDKTVEYLATVAPPIVASDLQDSFARGETGLSLNTDGSVGCSWMPIPDGWSSSFYEANGYEMGLSHYETYRRSDVRAELIRVIRDHDKAENDVLVITVAAPTKQGFYLPSSGRLAEMLFTDPDPLTTYTPKKVGAIVLHDAMGDRTRWLHGRNPLRR